MNQSILKSHGVHRVRLGLPFFLNERRSKIGQLKRTNMNKIRCTSMVQQFLINPKEIKNELKNNLRKIINNNEL